MNWVGRYLSSEPAPFQSGIGRIRGFRVMLRGIQRGVGSIPTAPTNDLEESDNYRKLGSNICTRLQLGLSCVLLDTLGMLFHVPPLRVHYDVDVYPERNSRIRVPHLSLHHRRRGSVLQQFACRPMTPCVKGAVRD